MREQRSNILTKWPVLQEYPVTPRDLDGNGRISDEVVERWTATARLTYAERCPALRDIQERSGLELRSRAVNVPSGAVLGRPTTVVVTAHVTEVLPSSLVMSVRIRPVGEGSLGTLDAAWTISVVDVASGQVRNIGEEIQAGLIAFERAAEHYN